MKVERLNPFILADSGKCVGCKTCEIACAVAHLERKLSTAGAAEGSFTPRLYVMRTPEITVPIQCRQCEDAPCAKVCQMSAISRVGGMVLVDTELCVGCKLCLVACPFGAIELVPQHRGVKPIYPHAKKEEEDWTGKRLYRANKCDLCAGRVEGPACMLACPQKALEMVNPGAESRKRLVEAAAAMADLRFSNAESH